MFTQEEYKALLEFLRRVDLKGFESTTHVVLYNKIASMIKPEEEVKKEDKK